MELVPVTIIRPAPPAPPVRFPLFSEVRDPPPPPPGATPGLPLALTRITPSKAPPAPPLGEAAAPPAPELIP